MHNLAYSSLENSSIAYQKRLADFVESCAKKCILAHAESVLIVTLSDGDENIRQLTVIKSSL